MQNPEFLDACIAELEAEYFPVEIIPGDRYHPVAALKISHVELPDTVIERHADILIPMARCAGFLPNATLAGLHVNIHLHGVYRGEQTIIPFCDPVYNIDWMLKTRRFYPFYDQYPEKLIGSAYLCLNQPGGQPETPAELMHTAIHYLSYWQENIFDLALHHGAVIRGSVSGDKEESFGWIEHLVEHVSPTLKTKLFETAGIKE